MEPEKSDTTWSKDFSLVKFSPVKNHKTTPEAYISSGQMQRGLKPPLQKWHIRSRLKTHFL